MTTEDPDNESHEKDPERGTDQDELKALEPDSVGGGPEADFSLSPHDPAKIESEPTPTSQQPDANADETPKVPHVEPSGASSTSDETDSFVETASDEVFVLPGGKKTFVKSAQALFRKLAALLFLFFQDDRVVEVVRGVGGVIGIREVSPAAARSRFERAGTFIREGSDNKGNKIYRETRCSEDAAKALLESLEAREYLPPLSIVMNCGALTVGPNGKGKILGPGYHRELDGVFVVNKKAPQEVPVAEAKRSILQIFSGFRFVNDADLARTIAAVLAAVGIRGGLFGRNRVPGWLFLADVSQTGKTYLQKLIAALLGEVIAPVTQRKGGVGSWDEACDAALQSGLSLILLDNLRGSLDSTHLESFMTWDTPFATRTPHRKWVNIDPLRRFVLATSNGVELTKDMRNRMVFVRLLKHAPGHQFKKYPEGDVLAHVHANQLYYLGCVISLLRPWVDAGRPSTNETRHDLRGCIGALDWIMRDAFPDLPRIMDDMVWPEDKEGEGEDDDTSEAL